MSNFDPNRNKLSPQEWEHIASEEIEETGAQLLVIGGILAGFTVAAATAFPLTGALVTGWAWYNAYRKVQGTNKNEQAISEYGCVAHVLKGDKLADFRQQVGDEEALRQIQWASDRGYAMSGDAQDLLESAVTKPVAVPVGDRISQVAGSVQGAISKFLPAANAQVQVIDKPANDLISAMADRVRNTLVIGAQGSGKGLTISNALDAVKQKHPDTTIFYIDPKNDEKETGYFNGRVDVLRRIKGLEKSPSAVVEWFKASIKEFQVTPGKKLLILDEATFLSTLMKNEGEGNWFKSLIVGLVSVGDSAGWNIWILCLNPNTDDIGISGGLRSQLMPLALITADSLATYTALISTQWLPKDKKLPSERIQELCNESEVNRCYYYGKFNSWNPLPRLNNFSGYDRDSRTQLEGDLDATNELNESAITEPEIQDSVVDSVQPGNQNGLSPDAQLLLSYFDNVKVKSAKTLKDLKDANKLRELNQQQLMKALSQLVAAEILDIDDDGSYLKVDC